MKFSRLRGVKDVFGEETAVWEKINAAARKMFSLYGYTNIITPVIEDVNLFARGIGEGTDIVIKEMYDFKDKGDRHIVLRPEGTASVVRAYIENSLPVKSDLYYYGPMFRYERPQKGRFREFFQIGAESFGEASPYKDAEVIKLAQDILTETGIKDCKLLINNLGAEKDYRENLVKYLEERKSQLCEDCLKKIERAPIRVLDCKNEKCKETTKNAPLITDNLTPQAAAHYAEVKRLLTASCVKFEEDPKMVRGLDYYTGTVFEFTTQLLGPQQNTILAGGRYDNLVAEFGGKSTPATGFAMGMERMAEVLKTQQGLVSLPFGVFIVYDAKHRDMAFNVLNMLRQGGIKALISFEDKSFKAQFREADSKGVKHVIVIGDTEAQADRLAVKDMKTGEQMNIETNEAVKYFFNNI
ncbi:MAG: histidine--tRNA ligase [Candidatus Goldiibacteriota bacterium HGW-Goldbacteria-1]|jgi:histidyl-tRNA synthetase|nr:MAG: histidine--tRNA ligase [Candidatus Goldiibacteriota bacterium HGW-Goldbacteria-1]